LDTISALAQELRNPTANVTKLAADFPIAPAANINECPIMESLKT
jgi:hypothetical protein